MSDLIEVESARREAEYLKNKIKGHILCICRLGHKRCVCADAQSRFYRHQQPPFNDHAENFIQDGRRIWVSQPYVGNNLIEIVEQSKDYAKRWDLIVRFSISESWHFPGRTILVEYKSHRKPRLNVHTTPNAKNGAGLNARNPLTQDKMYPDRADASKLVTPQEAHSVWRDSARVYNFLLFAKRHCHTHGKHSATELKEIKSRAEKFIGHEVTDLAFLVGCRFAGLLKTFGKPTLSQTVKFPPVDKLNEVEWRLVASTVEAEISEQ